MPTTRPRHVITETPEIAEALDVARKYFPDDRENPRRLLVDLIEAGARALDTAERNERADRAAAVEAAAGSLTDCFPDGYLGEVREGWTA